MELSDLKRLVALGEGPHLEFKRKVPRPERIAKEIIALANAQGGKLLLGIDDDGTVLGVRDAEEELYALEAALDAHCDPPVTWTLRRVPVSHRREVVVIEVPNSARKPHFLRVLDEATGAKALVAYIRFGHQSIEASPEQVRLLEAEQNPQDTHFTFGANEQKLMRYLDRFERITVAQFAQLADVSREEASETLVLLARARILRLHPDEKADYFTLAYDVP